MNAELDAYVAAYGDTNPLTSRKKQAAYTQRVQGAVELFKKTDGWNNVTLHGSPQERGQQFAMLLVGDTHSNGFTPHRPDVRIRARRALVEIGFALELYRLKQGRYPRSLEDLVPAILKKVPLDPDSGKLPIYRRGGPSGFIVYSVGQNQQDDGGKVQKDLEDPANGDDVVVEGPAGPQP